MEDIPLFAFGEEQPRFCRVPDFARKHDVAVQTLYSAESSGRIIGMRLGRTLYLNVESAENFMANRRKLTTTPKED